MGELISLETSTTFCISVYSLYICPPSLLFSPFLLLSISKSLGPVGPFSQVKDLSPGLTNVGGRMWSAYNPVEGKTWETGPSEKTWGNIWKVASSRRELPDDRPPALPGCLSSSDPLLHLRPQTLCRTSPLRSVHTGGASKNKSKQEGFCFLLFSPPFSLPLTGG